MLCQKTVHDVAAHLTVHDVAALVTYLLKHGKSPRLFSQNLENIRRKKLQPLLGRLNIKKAGFHAFRHLNATLMDSLHIPLKTRQERLGQASTGLLTLDVYTHSDWNENVRAAYCLGNTIEKAVNSVSLTAVQQKGPAGGVQQALATQQESGCGGQI